MVIPLQDLRRVFCRSRGHNDEDFDCHPWLGLTYTKDAEWALNQYFDADIDEDDDDDKLGRCEPFVPRFFVPPGGANPLISPGSIHLELVQHGGHHADVWTIATPQLSQQIKPLLDDLASITNDCPLSR